LILEVFPASTNRKARFVVYEDNGETNDYKNDQFVKREFLCSSKAGIYEISYKEGAENDFQAISRDLIYKLLLTEKPSAVRLSGKKIKAFKLSKIKELVKEPVKKAEWNWDKESGQCVIKIPSSALTEIIIIEK
jgi:alpha-glucosidase